MENKLTICLKWAIYQLFRTYYTRIPPIKNTEIVNSFIVTVVCIPSIKSNSYGGHAFSATAPKLWNSIPEYIKRAETVETFKTRLKTFLFQKHYC